MRINSTLPALLLLLTFCSASLAAADESAEARQEKQAASGGGADIVLPAEIQKRNKWRDACFPVAEGQPAELPFSFLYDEKPSAKLLATWPRMRGTIRLPKDRTQHTFTWSDANTGLEVRCVIVEYADFPVVEWTVYCKNTGRKETPLIENLQAIDVALKRGDAGEFLLDYNKGDTSAADLYQPLRRVLAPDTSLRLAPVGGRGTNHAFPYYSLSMPGGGLILAVGWPGQWSTTFARDAGSGLRIVAGQEITHLKLRPGEEIRSPLAAFLFWEGDDRQRAQNLWRRWMFAHNLPRTAGDKLPPPIMPSNTSMEFNEMCDANEENQSLFIDRYLAERIPIDFWWMDAGWYPCKSWGQTGTWEPDLTRFPRGLRAVSDYARGKGVKTIVWFEPERVASGTWLSQKHPEWLLGGKLLDLGNPAARKWITDHVNRVISEQGIDIYRQDFNMDPLDFWRSNDAPNRQGMTENLHVQGYLAYWDALRQRHPSLVIDSCASGGRRNDLETMRRAVALHPTDYNYWHLAAKQAFHQSLFAWLPYFGSNTLPCDTIDAYAIRSGHAMSCIMGYDLRRRDLDYALLRRLTTEARLAAAYYCGDYYPLTPYSICEEDWLAWQFHRPESQDGLVEAFRRPRNRQASAAFKLRGLDPRAVYEITDFDREDPIRATGRKLMEQGLRVTASRRPYAATLTYKRLPDPAAVITAPQSCEVHEPVVFSASDTAGADGEQVAFSWDFGDRATAVGRTVEHTYKSPRTYVVRLTVTDRRGHRDSTRVTVNAVPEDSTPPSILAVGAGEPEKVGIVFNKPIEQAGAENVSNYAIVSAIAETIEPAVRILSARLADDETTVTLRTAPLDTAKNYVIRVNHVKDRAWHPHAIEADSRRPFRYLGMYAWWKLDEGKGTAARDCSGNGRHGTLQGAHGGPAWVKDARGTVLSFDGVDSLVETDSCFPDLAMPFTICMWVNPAPAQSEHADILGNHGEPFVGINLQQDGGHTNSFGFGYGDGGRWQGSGAAQLRANQWQHLAVVCDGKTAVLYVDGSEKSKGPGVGPLAANTSQNFKLGQGYHSGRYFHGMLSDVRIFRDALSSAEIAALAHCVQAETGGSSRSGGK
jgi:alpha-galactosidase